MKVDTIADYADVAVQSLSMIVSFVPDPTFSGTLQKLKIIIPEGIQHKAFTGINITEDTIYYVGPPDGLFTLKRIRIMKMPERRIESQRIFDVLTYYVLHDVLNYV